MLCNDQGNMWMCVTSFVYRYVPGISTTDHLIVRYVRFLGTLVSIATVINNATRFRQPVPFYDSQRGRSSTGVIPSRGHGTYSAMFIYFLNTRVTLYGKGKKFSPFHRGRVGTCDAYALLQYTNRYLLYLYRYTIGKLCKYALLWKS